MINFDQLNENREKYRAVYINNRPFSHLVIDNFCHEKMLADLLADIPDPLSFGLQKSRDLIFAKNKFESAEFDRFSSNFADLKSDFLSTEFREFICYITGEEIFIDPDFHGGGLHQGGAGSFLDMHVDFNYHPQNAHWFRNINALLYLNPDWKPTYGGELRLKDGRKSESEETKIAPLFNRLVLMQTRDFTLHGYDPINFPVGEYRRSVAVYGYTKHAIAGNLRTTTWFPNRGGPAKRLLGKLMPKLVKIKSAVFGSSTSRNK